MHCIFNEYAGLSADEENKRCGLIACPALRDRPRENALRLARTNLIAPSGGRKDADHKSAGPRYLLRNILAVQTYMDYEV